jgi:hypothetical protein
MLGRAWTSDKKLTSLFFSLQRRNEAQAIVNAADITNWEKKNTRAMQNIFGAIKEEQSRILMTCNSAREMWIKLETEYEEAAADSIPLLWTEGSFGFKKSPKISISLKFFETLPNCR